VAGPYSPLSRCITRSPPSDLAGRLGRHPRRVTRLPESGRQPNRQHTNLPAWQPGRPCSDEAHRGRRALADMKTRPEPHVAGLLGPLTGMANRRRLDAALDTEWRRTVVTIG
jgi:hypothetical protein